MADPQTSTPVPTSPAGIPRIVLVLAGLAFAWVVVLALRQVSDIMAPVFLALNLMIVAYPIKSALAKRGVPQWAGALLATLTVLVVLVLFFWSLGWAVFSLATELPKYGDKFDELHQQGLDQLARVGVSKQQVDEQLQGIDGKSVMKWVTAAASMASNVLSLLTVVVTMLIFFAMDSIGFASRLDIARKHRPGLVNALERFGSGVRRYWVVSTVFGLIVAVLDWGLLMIVGVPLALVWAVLSFVTNYIPNIGFVFGLVPPALMALLDGGPVDAIIVVVGYSVLNFVVQSLIQPKVAGDAVGLTASLSFFSLLFWAWALGPMGAILALPASLLVKALLIDADPASRWANSLIDSRPQTADRGLPGATAAK